MAFYGNVTNTSKTTFSFDKTYSNRYEMDLNANRDGVFVGRYVLVDYDAGLKSASYILDKGNEHLYLYDNAETADVFNLYTNEPHYELDKYKNKIYTSADHYSFYEFKKDLDNGRCLVFHPKHVIKECNRESLYVRATKWLATENASVFFMGYEYVDKNAYLKYWEDNPDAQYIPVELNEFSYEPYLFYYRDVETGKFKLCETAMFDPDIEYYDLGDGNHNKVGIVDGNGVYFGTGEPDFTGKTIYRIDKGMKYNRNAELEYWAIVGWSTATRWVQNPNYNIADPKNNQPLIEAFIDVPVWGQLAAVKGSVDTTYELVEKPDLTKIDDYYVLDKGVYRKALEGDDGPFYLAKYSIDLIPVKGGANYNYDDDYTINMTIDRTYYGTSRGYDSTVWQKMFRNGRDEYVMVAELNSVVPTFDVEADAPTVVPLAPHFDPDSSNVFYRLHVQPAWGMRTKFADPTLQLPRINVNGQILDTEPAYARIPTGENKHLVYPSDQTVSLESDFYDKYNDEKTHKYLSVSNNQGTWVDAPPSKEKAQVPAAIYYNKMGFSPNVVTYSSDLIHEDKPSYNSRVKHSGWKNEDRFEVTPTGRSGLMYDNHGYGSQTTISVDTQEFSVMLPSLGDTVAKIWDLIYGGRDTNEAIRQTHKRNMDVAWEDARKGQDRKGLRMVGTQAFNGYNKTEVNTIAGCINSVHDLMGMIISKKKPKELAENLSELDESYLYYVDVQPNDPGEGLESELCKYKGQYLAKYKTYEYIPYEGEIGNFSTVTPTPGTDLSHYWVLEDEKYRPAKDGDVGPFYIKGDVAKYDPITPDDKLEAFDGTKYYYNDGCSLAGGAIDETRLLESDYVRDREYQRDRKYYELSLANNFKKVDVSQEFEPGRFYYYQNGDYVLSMEKEANPSIKYYEIDESKLVSLVEQGFDNVYSPGVYFYRDANNNFIIDTDDDGHWDHDGDGTPSSVGHYLAIAKKNPDETVQVQVINYTKAELTETEIATFDPSAYYIESANGVYVQNTAPYDAEQTYYYKVVSLVTQPTTEIYTVGDYVNLVPYTPLTFYCKILNDEGKVERYEHLTAQRIREIVHNEEDTLIYAFGVNELDSSQALLSKFDPTKIKDEQKRDPNKWACQEQSVFYVPGLYHYIHGTEENYTDLILDMYATMWHKGTYYKMIKEPTLVEKNFYEPYKYYTQNANGEYVLIKDNLTNDEINDLVNSGNIFLKDTYYVYEDTSGTFPKGMEWNPNVVDIPETVTLATRKETFELRVLEGFARDHNTIHGLILYINRLLMSNDEFTRDDRTLQGAINILNDKIAQFGSMTPSEVMVVDEMGRTQSAEIVTYQKDTANKVKGANDSPNTSVNADTYSKVNKLENMRGQWITVNVDPDAKNPKFTVHHNFQAVDNTTSSANMNKDGVTTQDEAHDTLDFYTPIVDAMGHIVGNNSHKVTLPYGFKFITTNGSVEDTVRTQLTPAAGTSVAESTQDEFTFNTGNKWIRTAMSPASDVMTIAHETHSLTTDAKSDTDLNSVGTFTVQDTQYDEAGHITHNQLHKYKLPFNFKTLSVGAAATGTAAGQSATGDIVADDHVAKFTISPNNRWITMSADTANDVLSIGHAYAGVVSQNDSQSENQTPKFGASFNIPYNGFDQAGHLSSFGMRTVTLPKPSLNVATGDVVSGLVLKDDTTGQFEMTKKNVGTFVIVDYVANADDTSDVSNADTINEAFAKLQAQAKAEIKNREDALSQEVEDRNTAIKDAVEKLVSTDNIAELTPEDGEAPTNLVVGGVTQENGVVSVVYRALEETDLPETALTITTEFVYNYEEPTFQTGEETLPPVEDGNEGEPALIDEEAGEEEIVEIPAKTIQWLFDKVAALEARIYQLENPYALTHPIEEEDDIPSENGEEPGETPVE